VFDPFPSITLLMRKWNENTKWSTPKEQQNNQEYNRGNSKLNENEVIEIKKLLKPFPSMTLLFKRRR
jgi:hypothetical protein